ncbi:hypothetical protein PLESTF_000621300 [Pleodorina starrii]|nr:hypothetical protein PLESTF_000621300 [Pleodorina starrii]
MEAAGVTTVVFSSPWEFLQPNEDKDLQYEYLDLLASSACKNTKLKVAFILDMVRAPAWVFARWPDARAADSHNRHYPLLSWFHTDANRLALKVLGQVAAHLVGYHSRAQGQGGACVTSLQPAFNNEYEAKYTQEHDCYQDYSAPALVAFRRWLQSRHPQLDDLNLRWSTGFSGWNVVVPPVLEAGAMSGADLTPRYWDFLKFREVYGATVLNRACAVVQASGALCFHHVPELFTVLVAVYGSTMFKHVAASRHTDFLVLDASFATPYGSPVSPSKLRLSVAAAKSYGKPVHLSTSVESSVGYDHLSSAFRTALRAGAAGVGVTNWTPHIPFNASLAAALAGGGGGGEAAAAGSDGASAPSPAAPADSGCPEGAVSERVGLFLHLDSCAAWHGLQWSSDSKDPLHDFVQAAAAQLSFECAPSLSMYLELDRLAAALPSLDRVLFVEPLVVWGAKEFETYTQVKAAVLLKRHEVLQFPGLEGTTVGPKLTVLEDL